MHILQNGKTRKNVHYLERPRNPLVTDSMRWQATNIFTLKGYPPLITFYVASNEVKECGLASSIGTDHRNQFTRTDGQVRIHYRHKFAKRFFNTLNM